MNIHFTEGYEYYKAHGDSTQFDLRTKHPMWRAGFNSAKTSNPIKASSDTEPRPGGYTWPSFLEDANE